jgi:hypothetical protein
MPAADLGAFPEMNNSAEVTGAAIGAQADVARLRRVISVAASVDDFVFGEAVLTRTTDTASTFRLAIAYKTSAIESIVSASGVGSRCGPHLRPPCPR